MKGSRANNILETHRLVLRPWSRNDVDGYHRLWGDPKVVWWRTPSNGLEESEQQLDALVARCESLPDGHGWWCIRERATDEVVGSVMLQPLVGHADEIELGYHIASARWGDGIATEAGRAIVNYGSLVLGLKRIVAVVHVDNPASEVVITRLGFRAEGEVTHGGLPHRLFAWTPEVGTDHWEPVDTNWP